MRQKKIGIYFMTALLLSVILVLGLSDREEGPPFSFLARTQAGTEAVPFWENWAGDCFVFLPSYAELNQLKVRTDGDLQLDDFILSDGSSCGELQLDHAYGMPDGRTLTFLGSKNTPALYIDTASGNLDQIHGDKTNRERGVLRLYSPEGRLECSASLDYLKARGNSTFFQEKKPYSFKLSKARELLGMGAAQKWVLLANAMDPSLIRNKLVYDFAREAGLPYTPDSRFVDLYLNGEYAGLYQLCEPNEIHPQRVNIQHQGSFLVSVDRPWDTTLPVIQTESGVPLRVRESGMDEESLYAIWQAAENAIRTGEQLTDRIDLDSWVRKYLLEEIVENPDGGRFSSFYYRDGGDPSGRIYAGPVWDFDFALSNPVAYREYGETGYRESRFNTFYVNSNPDSWFYWLYRQDLFAQRVRALYRTDFLPLLEALPDKAETYGAEIAQAARLNQIRWGTPDSGEETRAIQNCIEKRTEFLNSVWLEDRAYLTVCARYVDRNVLYLLEPGENLSQLPVFDSYDWYISGTETVVDLWAPVREDMSIELRKPE